MDEDKLKVEISREMVERALDGLGDTEADKQKFIERMMAMIEFGAERVPGSGERTDGE